MAEHGKPLVKYDPTVNLGTLIQLITFMLFLVAGYTVMQIQISLNASAITALKNKDETIEAEFKTFESIYREDSKHLQEKLGELNVNVTRALQKLENR
ncbi:hypothetical protein J7438_07120 [Thalassotalea sp. G20_0]|uniref:hypothetical protein n=1 Tax=Thalassotalea sp. G20_0 TaxID=2821093 RepID=UPI001ADD0DEC|nr:hypothetical protein [Thalassotalea sp. G20_0]MBO9493856.1 hypothetical protein [Thalassotalea sp. G20_0]